MLLTLDWILYRIVYDLLKYEWGLMTSAILLVSTDDVFGTRSGSFKLGNPEKLVFFRQVEQDFSLILVKFVACYIIFQSCTVFDTLCLEKSSNK